MSKIPEPGQGLQSESLGDEPARPDEDSEAPGFDYPCHIDAVGARTTGSGDDDDEQSPASTPVLPSLSSLPEQFSQSQIHDNWRRKHGGS